MIRARYLVGLAGAATVALLAAGGPAAAAVTWVQIPTPDAAGSDVNQLTAATTVSTTVGTTPGASEAWSVGLTRGASASAFHPLVEHWTAARGWQLSGSATIAAATNAQLFGVAGSAPTDVWTVGEIGNTQATMHGLFEHWNGTAWTRVNAPATEPAGSSLAAVETRTGTDAWAVGTNVDPNTLRRAPLLEHWNGTAWSVAAAPALPDDAFLFGVAASSATDAWAVGELGERALALHWNGTAWSQVAVAPPSGESRFEAVAVTSATDVWAVGQQRSGATTLVEHFDGTAWSVVPSANGTATNNTLAAVTVLGAKDVWAVGFGTNLGAFQSTLTEHWDGTAWTLVPSPNVAGAFGTQLLGVTGRTGGPLLGVGTVHASDGTYHTFGISG